MESRIRTIAKIHPNDAFYEDRDSLIGKEVLEVKDFRRIKSDRPEYKNWYTGHVTVKGRPNTLFFHAIRISSRKRKEGKK